jgi:hydroxymethylbilane synthase
VRAVSAPDRIVIASRASTLALWQSRHVQTSLLGLYPECEVSILSMSTRGDEILDRSLAKIGGKGLFVKELENALVAGQAQIAVHSMKDVPMVLPEAFAIGAITLREDPRDAFVSNRYRALSELPAGACVGTSSLRREAQLRARFASLKVQPLRGNVQTRLRKLDAGEFDAIILAAAGLKRLGLGERIAALLSPEESLPAPGQGALGIECLHARRDLIASLAPLADRSTAQAVQAERTLSRLLGGSCQVPLGAYAQCDGERMRLRGFVATPDGRTLLTAEASGPAESPDALGAEVAAMLRARGADAVLAALGIPN